MQAVDKETGEIQCLLEARLCIISGIFMSGKSKSFDSDKSGFEI